jgi:hypothetical protein
MMSLLRQVFGVLAVALLLASPLIVPAMYRDYAGFVTAGVVETKHEAVELMGNDRSFPEFIVSLRYQPRDSEEPETATSRIDPDLYDRLQVGSQIEVRYLPWKWARWFTPAVPLGRSALARFKADTQAVRSIEEVAGFVAIVVLGVIAYRRKSKSLGLLALTAGGVFVSAYVLLGFVVFPAFFWLWRRYPGEGFGWVLLITMALTPPALSARFPRTPVLATDALQHTTARVRQVYLAEEIGPPVRYGGGGAGIALSYPFQMVDLELAPEGFAQPVHAVDRVDPGSVAGLELDAEVKVVYATANPRAAQIDGATRTYPQRNLWSLLMETYAGGLGISVLMWAVGGAWSKIGAAFRNIESRAQRMGVDAEGMAQLPGNDPRRTVLESFGRIKEALRSKPSGS